MSPCAPHAARLYWLGGALLSLLLAGCASTSKPDQWGILTPETWPVEPREAELPPSVLPTFVEAAPVAQPTPSGPLDLSIEEAVILVLQRNRDLRVQQLGPVITGTFEQIERGVFDPELFANLTYREQESTQSSLDTGQQFNFQSNAFSGDVGVRQQLPTGTTVEASVEQRRNASSRSPEQQSARIGLTITQSLLRGLGPAVNLASVRQAELDTQASLYELRGFTETLLADTEIAYWNYVLAQEEIAIFESSLEIAQRQRDTIEQQIEVGVLPETEAAAARAEVARREQALIDARSNLERRRLRLARLLNPRESHSLEVSITASSSPRLESLRPIADLPDRLTLASQERPDLQEARLRLRRNELATVVTRNGLMPDLELFVDLGRTGFASRLDESFKELDGAESFDLASGIRFSHYLNNRAASGRDLRARASRQQAAEAIENLTQQIRLEVRLAATEVERARQQIAASAATLTLQEQAFQAEQERFEVGASTSLLVAQAQRDLLASRIAEIEATIAYRIALVELYLAEGSLLQRRGVQIGPQSPSIF